MIVPKKMSKRKNLNELFTQTVQTKRLCTVAGNSNIQIIFNNIEERIIELLGDSHCKSVAIMGPYFSNRKILKKCSEMESCSIITNYEKGMKSKVRMDAFNALSPLLNARVKTLNAGRGRNKSILHSKVLILLDERKKPFKAVAGSWNFSGNACNNIEQMTVYSSPLLTEAFFEEFKRVWKISKRFI